MFLLILAFVVKGCNAAISEIIELVEQNPKKTVKISSIRVALLDKSSKHTFAKAPENFDEKVYETPSSQPQGSFLECV